MTYKVVAKMMLLKPTSHTSSNNNVSNYNNQFSSRDNKDKGFTYKDDRGMMYQFYIDKDDWLKTSSGLDKNVINRMDGSHVPNTNTKDHAGNIENPWEDISYVYNRFFLCIHIMTIVVCFAAIYLYYQWE